MQLIDPPYLEQLKYNEVIHVMEKKKVQRIGCAIDRGAKGLR
jgi:hypothetical protein